MQELYLAVLKAQPSHTISHPKAYLFTVAANLAHQHRQRKAARPHIGLADVPVEVTRSAVFGLKENPPECAAALAQRISELGQRLSELPPKVRAAVIWHHRDEYTCGEIGEELSVVRHRVKKYLVKGMMSSRRISSSRCASAGCPGPTTATFERRRVARLSRSLARRSKQVTLPSSWASNAWLGPSGSSPVSKVAKS